MRERGLLIFISFKIKYLNVFFIHSVREFNEIIPGMQKEFSTFDNYTLLMERASNLVGDSY